MVHCDTLSNIIRPTKAIWYFKQKQKPEGELLKYKAFLCAHGGIQKWGNSYWETYSLVINILSVRLIHEIYKIHNIDSKAIYFVLAFSKVDLEDDIMIQLPIAFQVEVRNEADTKRHYILKLNKCLYIINQGSYNWYEKQKKSLVDQWFKSSDIDPYLYTGKCMIVLTNVNKCIIVVPSMIDTNIFVELTKTDSKTLYRPKEDIKINSLLLKLTN